MVKRRGVYERGVLFKGTQLYNKVASSYSDNWGKLTTKLTSRAHHYTTGIPHQRMQAGKLLLYANVMFTMHLLCVFESSDNRIEIIIGLPHGI